MASTCVCCGACCKNHTIMLTFEDIRRIHARKPSISLHEYVMIADPAEDEEIKRVMAEYFPTIKFSDPAGEINGYLALRIRPIQDTFDFKCYFYDLESKHCGIHVDKPIICRIYPLWLEGIIEKKDMVSIQSRLGQDPSSLKVIWKNGRCPKPWNPLSKEEIESFWKTFAQLIEELEAYSDEAGIWNDNFREKALDDLLAFIIHPKKMKNRV